MHRSVLVVLPEGVSPFTQEEKTRKQLAAGVALLRSALARRGQRLVQWRVGGQFDGMVRGKPATRGLNYGAEFETLNGNSMSVRQVVQYASRWCPEVVIFPTQADGWCIQEGVGLREEGVLERVLRGHGGSYGVVLDCLVVASDKGVDPGPAGGSHGEAARQ